MMTLILIVSFLLIAFVIMVRIDIHRHKYTQPQKPKQDGTPAEASDKAVNHPGDSAKPE
jgi:hypothetical protein